MIDIFVILTALGLALVSLFGLALFGGGGGNRSISESDAKIALWIIAFGLVCIIFGIIGTAMKQNSKIQKQ
jgi:hypothetical protein